MTDAGVLACHLPRLAFAPEARVNNLLALTLPVGSPVSAPTPGDRFDASLADTGASARASAAQGTSWTLPREARDPVGPQGI